MKDTMRIIKAIIAIKLQCPDLRCGQIIANVVHDMDIFYVRDDDLADRLENWETDIKI